MKYPHNNVVGSFKIRKEHAIKRKERKIKKSKTPENNLYIIYLSYDHSQADLLYVVKTKNDIALHIKTIFLNKRTRES